MLGGTYRHEFSATDGLSTGPVSSLVCWSLVRSFSLALRSRHDPRVSRGCYLTSPEFLQILFGRSGDSMAFVRPPVSERHRDGLARLTSEG